MLVAERVENVIPKKIHYCWFGKNPKPKLAQKCISSWKKYCPDYEIIEWNEDNFDVRRNAYTQFCYEHQKWAFLSDFVRLAVVEEQGGVYFDTDVELLKVPDELLKYGAFYGFETDKYVATGLGFGAEAHHPTIVAMVREYEQLAETGPETFLSVACPQRNTAALVAMGLITDGSRQNVAGAEIFPVEWFNPYDDPTGRLRKTKNTVSVHWYSKSWMSSKSVLRSKLTKPFHRLFGKDCFAWLKRIMK